MLSRVSASLVVRVVLLAGILVAAAEQARADVSAPGSGGGAPLDPERIFKAPLGSWEEYELTGVEHRMTARYALVRKDAQSFTIEMIATLSASDKLAAILRTVHQMDYTTDGKRWRVVRSRQKVGEQPARVVPHDKTEDARPPTPLPGGDERITTPAGTFTCRRYRLGEQDLWLTTSLPLLGMVKMSMARPVPITITLRAYGAGARPSFE